MARMRTVKPEFWTDEELAIELTRDERLFYIGLWNIADEHSRLRGNPQYIKGQLFPYDDDMTADVIEKMLDTLVATGRVIRYRNGVGHYLFLTKLAKHQRLDADKVVSRLPEPNCGDGQAMKSPSEFDPDEVKPDPTSSRMKSDEVESDPTSSALLYVAGSMEHVTTSSTASPSKVEVEADETSDEVVLSLPASSCKPVPTPKRSRTKPDPNDPKWLEFWSVFPRRQGKQEALKAWTKAVQAADPDQIIAGAGRYREIVQRNQTPNEKIKMAQGWLNGRRWEDEPPTPLAPPPTEAPPPEQVRRCSKPGHMAPLLANGTCVACRSDANAQVRAA